MELHIGDKVRVKDGHTLFAGYVGEVMRIYHLQYRAKVLLYDQDGRFGGGQFDWDIPIGLLCAYNGFDGSEDIASFIDEF